MDTGKSRYRIIVREVQVIEYEVEAYNIEGCLDSVNWDIRDTISHEDTEVLKIEKLNCNY